MVPNIFLIKDPKTMQIFPWMSHLLIDFMKHAFCHCDLVDGILVKYIEEKYVYC